MIAGGARNLRPDALAESESSWPEEHGSAPRREEPEACGYCFGTGMEVVPGKGARRCRCKADDRLAALLERARIPRRYEDCSLANYVVEGGNASLLRAFGLAFKLANEYPAVERGLLLAGPVGTGKTHLCVAILKELLGRGVPSMFCEFGQLLKMIQDSYNPVSQSSELQVLASVLEVDVLVLDELGATKPTEWVRDTMLHVIGRRYNERRLTIFTTNYLDERPDLHNLDSGALRGVALQGKKSCSSREAGVWAETLEDRIGVRLRSRLYEMCETVVLSGPDYRKRSDASGGGALF